MLWQFQRGTNLCNMLSPGYNILNAVCHWTAPSGRGEGKQISWHHSQTEGQGSGNCPCSEEEIQVRVSSCSKWWRGWTLTTNEEMEPEVVTQSLSLSELQKEFTHRRDESIFSWLLEIGANDMNLGGNEARQLGFLFQDMVIDQRTGKSQEHLSLWRRLSLNVKERYLCKEETNAQQGHGKPWSEVSTAWEK